MEVWITVVVALIVALSTLGASWLQNKYSYKRFKSELERAREVDKRQIRLEVRGKPLRELKTELASMASKLDRLVKAAYHSHGMATEKAKEEFERAKNDWNEYISSDNLSRALFTLDDQEIIGLVKKARDEYLDSYEELTFYREELTAVEVGEFARAPEEKIRSEIINIQELINKRLEEL
jgi:DNA-binding helix-hairpin-helix protein with protein kinase domain